MVVLFLLSVFAGRLLQLQALDASALAAEARETRTSKVRLFAHRGDITDASGDVLATTHERRNVLVDQTLVSQYHRRVGEARVKVGLTGAAEDLAPLLKDSPGRVARKLKGTSRGALLAGGVTPEVAREIMRLAIPGVNAEQQASRRVYPAGTTAANVLGFSNQYGDALGGIEQAYDKVLAGTPGSMTYEHGRDGAQIPTGVSDEVDPKPGWSVRLTLDRDLQWKAQELLAEQVRAVKAKSGYAVVMDPRSGDVLALATSPTFDPNDPGKAPAEDRGDRSLLDVFEPGSTSKVITLAAALEEKVATPGTRVTVPSRLGRAGRSFRDAEDHGTEKLTVAGVLAQSSNVGTILVGEKLDRDTTYRYLRGFGLGSPTGVGLPESAGILAKPQDWDPAQRYTVMFGQGVAVTALQAASVFATLANDGVRVQPRIVAGQTDARGVFHPADPPRSTRVVSADTARQMRLMMESVVGERGTAVRAGVPGYRVAGKTGTSEFPDPTCGCYRGYTASFIGMAPADKPSLVIAVVLQQPTKGYYGGVVAAPVFKRLMTYALAQRRVPPTGTKAPAIPLRWR